MNLNAKIVAILAITVISIFCVYTNVDGDAATIALSGLLGFLAGDGFDEKKE